MGKYKVEISGFNTSEINTLSYDEMKILFAKAKDGDLFKEIL